jgi:hypothetical protein
MPGFIMCCERAVLGVFRGDLEVAADVMRDQFLDVFRRLHGQVVAHAGADQDLLDAGQRTRLAVDLDQRAVVGIQVFADVREHAGLRRRQADSIFGSLQASRYMLAVGPPRSEITPVKPGVLSRMASISCRIDSSERLWMMRPSCSVMEQKVQPPKQPRMMLMEKRIISQAGIFASP